MSWRRATQAGAASPMRCAGTSTLGSSGSWQHLVLHCGNFPGKKKTRTHGFDMVLPSQICLNLVYSDLIKSMFKIYKVSVVPQIDPESK
jgi:hypothetical protein